MKKLKYLWQCWQLVFYKILILIGSTLILILLTLLTPISKTSGLDKVTDDWWQWLKYDDLFDEWW